MHSQTETRRPGRSGHLLKILGVSFGVAVAIGQMIGSGILRSPSLVAGYVPGEAVILGLWALAALHVALSANLNAELGVALPRSGGGYVYAHRALGDIGGLIVGWSDWISNLAGAAAASVSFAEFLPLLVPSAEAHKVAVALALQLALYAANIMGLREGRALQEATSFTKAAMLFVFILAAVLLVAPAEPANVLPVRQTMTWAGIVLAYQLIMGAYAGWGTPLYFAGENEAPEKSLPRALFLGIIFTATIYIGVNWALLHALDPAGVSASPLPFAVVLDRIGGRVPSILFAITAMITVASCANACMMAAPRILYALASDGLLPRRLCSVNKGGSPVVGYLMTAAGTLTLAATGTFGLVFGLIATLNAVGGVLVDSSFFILRWREPGLARPYRAHGYPVLPLLPLLADATILVLFATADMVGAAVAVGLGLCCVPLAIIARRARTEQFLP